MPIHRPATAAIAKPMATAVSVATRLSKNQPLEMPPASASRAWSGVAT